MPIVSFSFLHTRLPTKWGILLTLHRHPLLVFSLISYKLVQKMDILCHHGAVQQNNRGYLEAPVDVVVTFNMYTKTVFFVSDIVSQGRTKLRSALTANGWKAMLDVDPPASDAAQN